MEIRLQQFLINDLKQVEHHVQELIENICARGQSEEYREDIEEIEGRIKAFKYPISRWRKQSFLGIDLEDITNSRNINRVGYNDWKTGKLIE